MDVIRSAAAEAPPPNLKSRKLVDQGHTQHAAAADSSCGGIPAGIWSRLVAYSKYPKHVRQTLTAVSPAVRLALTPVAVSHHSHTRTMSGGIDLHDSYSYTPSIQTPNTSLSSPSLFPQPIGLSCDALRVHRWWLWGLQSFPLNLDVHLGNIAPVGDDGAAGGGALVDTHWTPASLHSTPQALSAHTMSPMMLLGSGRVSGPSPIRGMLNTAGEGDRERGRTGGSAAGNGGGGVAEGIDAFPSAPLDPVSLAFPFSEEHWDDCQVRAVHIRTVQEAEPHQGGAAVHARRITATFQKLSVCRELDIGHRVMNCLARARNLENFALSCVPRGFPSPPQGGAMVHGYFNPLFNPNSSRTATPGGQRSHTNQPSPSLRPTAPFLGVPSAPIAAPAASIAAWMNTSLLLLVPVAVVPLSQQFAPHLTTMSISNARIVATTESIGGEGGGGGGDHDVHFPIGASSEDIAEYRHMKELEDEAYRRRKAAEEEAAARAAVEASGQCDEDGAQSSSSRPPPGESLAAFDSVGDTPPCELPSKVRRRRGGEGLPPSAVQRLRLVDCVVDGDALQRLAELHELEHLVFIGCTFPTTTGLDGLEFLATGCPKLQHLVISACDIRSAAPIAMLAQLITLDLSENPNLNDIAPLEHLTQLEEINLNGCCVRSVAPLIGCSYLWKVEAAGNPLGPGFGHTVAGSSMSSSSSLAAITTASRSVGLSPKLAPALAPPLPSTTRAPLNSAALEEPSRNNAPSSSSTLTPSPCGGLELLKRLEYLDVEHCGLVDIAPLASLSSLRYLSLARNRIRHDDYPRLPPEFGFFFPFLVELNLSKTSLAFLRHIDGLRKLKVLWIGDNCLVHHAFPQHLACLPELVVLHADNCGLDDIRRIHEICPKLQHLYASKNKQLTDDRMPPFSQMTNLDVVHLRACSLTAVKCFRDCSQIRELDVSDNTLTRGGADELADTAASMEVLMIANCGIRDTTFLKDLVHLVRVDLRGNVLNAALPPYFMMLDAHAAPHSRGHAAPSAPSPLLSAARGVGGGGGTPGSLSSRSSARLYGGSSALDATGGEDNFGTTRGGAAALHRSSSALLQSPHVGPSAASPSRHQSRQAHMDPLGWNW